MTEFDYDKALTQSDNDVLENIQVKIDKNTIQEFMRNSYWHEEYLFYQIEQYSREFNEKQYSDDFFIYTILSNGLVLLFAGLEHLETGEYLGLFVGWLLFSCFSFLCFLIKNIVDLTFLFEKGESTRWEICKNYWANALPLWIFFIFSLLLYPLMCVVSHFASGWYANAITELNVSKTKPYRWLFNLTKRWTTSKMCDGFYWQFNLYSTKQKEHMAKIICLYMSLRKNGKHHLTERQMLNHWRELSANKDINNWEKYITMARWLDLTQLSERCLTPLPDHKEVPILLQPEIQQHNYNVPIPIQY